MSLQTDDTALRKDVDDDPADTTAISVDRAAEEILRQKSEKRKEEDNVNTKDESLVLPSDDGTTESRSQKHGESEDGSENNLESLTSEQTVKSEHDCDTKLIQNEGLDETAERKAESRIDPNRHNRDQQKQSEVTRSVSDTQNIAQSYPSGISKNLGAEERGDNLNSRKESECNPTSKMSELPTKSGNDDKSAHQVSGHNVPSTAEGLDETAERKAKSRIDPNGQNRDQQMQSEVTRSVSDTQNIAQSHPTGISRNSGAEEEGDYLKSGKEPECNRTGKVSEHPTNSGNDDKPAHQASGLNAPSTAEDNSTAKEPPKINITSDDIDSHSSDDDQTFQTEEAGGNRLKLVDIYMAERSAGESGSGSSDSESSYSSDCSSCQLQKQKRMEKTPDSERSKSSCSYTTTSSGSSSCSESNSSVVEKEKVSAKEVPKELPLPTQKPVSAAVRFKLNQSSNLEKAQLPRSPWPGRKSSDSVENQTSKSNTLLTVISPTTHVQKSPPQITKSPKTDDAPPVAKVVKPMPSPAIKRGPLKKTGPVVVTFGSSSNKAPLFGTLGVRITYDSSAAISSLDKDALGNLNIAISKCEGVPSDIDSTKIIVKFVILKKSKPTQYRGKLGIGTKSRDDICWDKDLTIRNVPVSALTNGVLRASISRRETFGEKCLASCEVELIKQQRFSDDAKDVVSTAEWLAVRRKEANYKFSLH